MALRRSRRLQKMQPEETDLGLCLICQDHFSVEVLHRLGRTDCCQTLFHPRCYAQMMTHTSRCPACRYENEPENPRALELPQEFDLEADLEEAELQLLVFSDPEGTFATIQFQAQVSEEITKHRFRGLPFTVHRFGTFCLILSLNIIFLPICMQLNDLFKSMWVIQCICTVL